MSFVPDTDGRDMLEYKNHGHRQGDHHGHQSGHHGHRQGGHHGHQSVHHGHQGDHHGHRQSGHHGHRQGDHHGHQSGHHANKYDNYSHTDKNFQNSGFKRHFLGVDDCDTEKHPEDPRYCDCDRYHLGAMAFTSAVSGGILAYLASTETAKQAYISITEASDLVDKVVTTTCTGSGNWISSLIGASDDQNRNVCSMVIEFRRELQSIIWQKIKGTLFYPAVSAGSLRLVDEGLRGVEKLTTNKQTFRVNIASVMANVNLEIASWLRRRATTK